MRIVCLIVIVLYLMLDISGCKQSQEQAKPKPEVKTESKVEKKTEQKVRKKVQMPQLANSEDATIKIEDVSENVVAINLTNKVPIRGVQFTIEGVQMEKGTPTSRTKGFTTDFNNESGRVVILSTTDNRIASGTGNIFEIVCSKVESAKLSGIKIIK